MGDVSGAEKPGWKTSEFWICVAVIVAGCVSGFLAEGSTAQMIVAGVLQVAAALGYTASRAKVKVASSVPVEKIAALGAKPEAKAEDK